MKHAFKTALSLFLSLSLVLSTLPAQAFAQMGEEGMGEETPTAQPTQAPTLQPTQTPTQDSPSSNAPVQEELQDQTTSNTTEQTTDQAPAPETVEEGQMGEAPATASPDNGTQSTPDSGATSSSDSPDATDGAMGTETTATDDARGTEIAKNGEMGTQGEAPTLDAQSTETPILDVQNTGDDTWQTARTLAEGVSATGALTKNGDEDWYKFTAPRAGCMSLNFTRYDANPGGIWRVVLYSYSSGSLTRLDSFSVDRYDDMQKTVFRVGVPQGGVYYVAVTYAAFTGKTYTIKMGVNTESLLWEREPQNDTYRGAVDISNEETYAGTTYNSSDYDWFSFTAWTSGPVYLGYGYEGTSVSTNWTIDLYADDAQTLIASWSCSSTGQMYNASCPIGATRGTKFYVRVRGAGSAIAAYQIRMSMSSAGNWESEPYNNERSTGLSMSAGQTYKATLCDYSDRDWFKFTAPEEGGLSLIFSRSSTSVGQGWKFDVYAGEDTLPMGTWSVDANSDDDVVTPELGLSAGRTYYIKVYAKGTSKHSNTTYGLTASFTTGNRWEYEFNNDSYGNAQLISLGTVYFGSTHKYTDADWYSFKVPNGGYVTLNFGCHRPSYTGSGWRINFYDHYTHDLVESYYYVPDSPNDAVVQLGLSNGQMYDLRIMSVNSVITPDTYHLSVSSNIAGYNVDLSCIFDPFYYAEKNPDVERWVMDGVGYLDADLLERHFVMNGMKEGRASKATFDLKSYYNANQDLRRAFGTSDWSRYYLHYASNGMREGRVCTGVSELRNPITTRDDVDWSPVYDGAYYASRNHDVARWAKRYFCSGDVVDDVALLQHFVNNGMKEGRASSPTFDIVSYYNANPDLRRTFGTSNWSKYYIHFMTNGRFEWRTTGGAKSLTGYMTYRDGVDWSPVYDGAYYAQQNGDVKNWATRSPAAGSVVDDAALLQHFVNNGSKEGRRSKAGFDLASYFNANVDLRAAFGGTADLSKYYRHYATNGQREGRTCSGVGSLQGSVVSRDGVNWWPVYDRVFYAQRNSDVASWATRKIGSFGYVVDDFALLQHFVNNGQKERRQAKSTFNVVNYRNRYADLNRAFGDNWPSYYRHFATNGYKENRNGA